ncbi:MAG: hypothetical protein NTX86_05240, partial [Candidatus Dependentiae bacterium]|nr:hypothetical protein [Candidatus Dependentiae bacterium]
MTLFFLLIMLCVGSIYGDIPTCQALQSLQEVCAQGAITFVLNAHADDHASLIEKSITKPFVLADINFESDVYFSPTEFDYLVDLRKGDVVTAQHIKKAVSYLFKKNKFSTISLTIRCCEQGNTIKIGLTSFWTFKKLKFHGMLIGKESYRQYYTMEPNDPFDEIKHQHALEKMREALRQEGYFNAEAVSQLKYDNGTKQIVAHVTLRKNERFGVADIKSEIKSDASISDCQRNEAEEIIQHHFLKKLDGGSYSKSSINKRTCALKRKLSQKGFIHVDVNLSERVDYEEHEVILSFVFDLHHKKEFIFTGNQFFSSERLLDSILEFGHSAWFLPSSILSDEIVQAYQKKGFWYVKVSSCEAPDNYIFEINEGERVSVKEVKVKNALGEDITKQLK